MAARNFTFTVSFIKIADFSPKFCNFGQKFLDEVLPTTFCMRAYNLRGGATAFSYPPRPRRHLLIVLGRLKMRDLTSRDWTT